EKAVENMSHQVCKFNLLLTLQVCRPALYAVSCFFTCDSNIFRYFDSNFTSFRVCKSFADRYFSTCGDYWQCTNFTAPCMTDPNTKEGCVKVGSFANAKEFYE